MMPWEHVVVGYVGFSLLVHVGYRDAPTGAETLVVGVASVLPDLVDKPLNWTLDLVATGYAAGHSVFVAAPAVLAASTLLALRGPPRIGTAFAVGYLLHLPADVVPAYLRHGRLPLERVLWPVRKTYPRADAFGEWIGYSLVPYLRSLLAVEATAYTAGVLGLLLAGTLLWIYDGMPLARELYRGLRRDPSDGI